jgi:ribosome biogenesis GTPase
LTFDLDTLGWTPELARAFADLTTPDLQPARVATQHRGRFILYAEAGELDAEVSGRLRHTAGALGFPAVGDWVAARQATGLALIEGVLPRRSLFSRSGADMTRRDGAAASEAIAANADLVLIVMAAHLDFNLRRLERFLAAAWESGAEPCVVLTKTDLVPDPEALLEQVAATAPGAAVVAVSNLTGEGVDQVRAMIGPGRTAALLGSSGVGKSSLVNGLLGDERQAVSGVRADGRGRHTTTSRELILLPGGGMVLDTPGMRLFTPVDDAGLDAAFSDIEALARACRFRDCRHQGEPGCAVEAAARAGALDPGRLAGWDKLKRELDHIERQGDKRAEAEHNRRWRAIHKAAKAHMRHKRSGWE